MARSMGRSRQALSRIKGSLDRKEVRRLSVKLNIRITEDEHAAFQAVAEANGLTVSEAVRHLVRQASDRLAIQADEMMPSLQPGGNCPLSATTSTRSPDWGRRSSDLECP